MFSSLRNLVAPKTIQEINYGIYHLVKLSMFMALYSFPWVLVNLLVKFSVETFILYAFSFIFVLPNILTIFYFFGSKEVSVKEYYHVLKIDYKKKIKTSSAIVLGISIYLLDCYILISQMAKNYLFPILYITMMFIVVSVIYCLIQTLDKKNNWRIIIKKAVITSWRRPLHSFGVFVLMILWLSFSYFAQGLNMFFGNALFWGLIYHFMNKKV